jgi:hypothetical protein
VPLDAEMILNRHLYRVKSSQLQDMKLVVYLGKLKLMTFHLKWRTKNNCEFKKKSL